VCHIARSAYLLAIIIVAVFVAIQLRQKVGHKHEGTDSTALLRKYKKE
ncbi:hypothetical protein V3C99_016229, partial [Haemonchus contortus]